LVWSLDRLDARQLDPNDAAEWALMLTRYARALNRVSRKIKGVVA
jgi:predicted nucleotidyltransferase